MNVRPAPEPEPTGRAAVEHRILDCPDLAAARQRLLREAASRELDVQGAAAERFSESILDTRDLRLQRAGTRLLRRDFADGCEVTWLGLPGDRAGARIWTSVALASARSAIPEDCPEPLRRKLRAVVGRRPLRPRLRLDLEREELIVKRRGSWVATVVFVECSGFADATGAPVRLRRMEWRLATRPDGRLPPLFAACTAAEALQPAGIPLHDAALAAAGAADPRRRDVGAMDAYLGMTTGELAFTVMRRQFRELRKREPGTRLGADPEELHRMRVAVRRLRAALRLWRPALGPQARDLQQGWGELGRALGHTRDLDVETEHLAEWLQSRSAADRIAFAPIEAGLAAQRGEARERMIEALDAPAQERLTRVTSRWLRTGPGAGMAARRPARRAAAALVLARHRAFLRRARRLEPDSRPEDYHRVRILAKQLRYCLEFHQPLLGPASRRYVRGLVAIQDLLGEYQDFHVFVDRFGRLGEDRPGVGPRARELIAERAQERRTHALALRDAFPGALLTVRGAAWRALKAELGVGQPGGG